MKKHYIQLQESNCRNCMRCVRVCPTKAMTYVDHQPIIKEDECILCGHCYLACNHSAKKVYSDLKKVKEWLRNNEKIIVSLAPSFASVWTSYNKLKVGLLELGFYKVEETMIGAKIVSSAYSQLLKEKQMKNIISSCCPSVVSLIENEYPDLIDQIAPIVSPMIAHGYKIKEEYPDVKVVFITPCIAKQKEIDDPRFSGAIDACITMPELATWLKSISYNLEQDEKWEAVEESVTRSYPIPSGILQSVDNENKNYRMVNIEGQERIRNTLDAIRSGVINGYFIEMSSCVESCVGGPLLSHIEHSTWQAQSIIFDNIVQQPIKARVVNELYSAKWKDSSINKKTFSEQQISDMLYLMGKSSEEKILDCGSCGYETCRDKAIAVLEGKADIKLCLPQALENAESISNQIIENTPNGILVVDKDLYIKEMNPAAKTMLKLDNVNVRGLPVLSLLPSDELAALLSKHNKIAYFKEEYQQYQILLEHAVISLEEFTIIVLMDLTIEEAKEKVIRRIQQQTVETAQRVIDDQMRSVQEIASLLGETTAKSKVALSELMKAMNDNG